ncbi:MAG TPA: VRR-NUC domain-containing protein [Candidatus Acidoferrales bacterium]|nr:VRR-NUC domain-containing protein [Candidatus Acidoferrales bacterium]
MIGDNLIRTSSTAEQETAKALKKEGWNITRTGWPDFLCWRDMNGEKQVMCIEVKGPGDKLSAAQVVNHAILISAGLPVHVSYSPADIKDLQEQRTLELLAAEILEEFKKRADRLEKLLVKTTESFDAHRTQILNEFDGRYAKHTDAAQDIITTFRKLAEIYEPLAKRKSEAA